MAEKNLIYVLNKKVALHQAPEGFRTSMDSVILGAACPAKSEESILDLGCGIGSAGLCAIYRINGATLCGIDIQEDHIKLANKNAHINDMAGRTTFICSDIRTAELGTFNHIICNPPYMEAGAHLQSPSPAKAKAMGHIEENIKLQDWIACAHKHIKGQGSLTMIHDAGQIDNIIHALYGKNGGRRFGAVEIIPIYSKRNTSAKRVIVRAYKHKKSKSVLHTGIIMHEQDGTYTKEADNILRHAASLFL
ncbi:MAG: methyltransferase [Zetaproteobacteria bacterium]|nr:MAG: methyltransferase [Zetaproteobacteria bacterium]